jgi:hypothetical protein
LSGFFFGTTHGININYFKKKNWLAINFIIKIIPPIINLLSYFLVIILSVINMFRVLRLITYSNEIQIIGVGY